jgi:hypothetical protein
MEALYSPDGYGGQLARLNFTDNGPAHTAGVYSFIYGNVGVISLDPNDVSYEIPANLGYSGGAQTPWLAGRLKVACGTRGCRCSISTAWTCVLNNLFRYHRTNGIWLHPAVWQSHFAPPLSCAFFTLMRLLTGAGGARTSYSSGAQTSS